MAGHKPPKKPTKRVDVNLSPDREVQLQTNRRFFSASGNNRAIREAKALQNAFGVGQEILSNQVDRSNVKGEARATGEAGSGQDRDREDKNFAYNKAWDEMDAERDVNLMAKELPEILRGANWFSLEEDAVRAIISDYQESSFAGVNPSSFYGVAIAKPLWAQEQELISQHRQEVLDKIQMEQRGTIQDNIQSRFEASKLESEDGRGVFPYDYLAQQTKQFFSGPNKRTVYWETIEHFSVTLGMPSILENIPSFFPNGDPTGINDERMFDVLRTAMTAANATRARIVKEERLVETETLNSAALELVVSVNSGTIPRPEMITSYSKLPGAKATVAAGLSKTLVALASNVESAKGDDGVVAQLTSDLYARKPGANQETIFEAYQIGDLGAGKAGVNQLQELLSISKSNDAISRSTNNEEFDFLLKDIDARYAIIKGPSGKILNSGMVEINRQALLTYHRAKAAGGADFNASAEWEKVIEPFDERRDRIFPKVTLIKNRPMNDVVFDYLQNKVTVEELQKTGITRDMINDLSLTDKEKYQLYDGLRTII